MRTTHSASSRHFLLAYSLLPLLPDIFQSSFRVKGELRIRPLMVRGSLQPLRGNNRQRRREAQLYDKEPLRITRHIEFDMKSNLAQKNQVSVVVQKSRPSFIRQKLVLSPPLNKRAECAMPVQVSSFLNGFCLLRMLTRRLSTQTMVLAEVLLSPPLGQDRPDVSFHPYRLP